jgi:hypothetical protein
MPVASKATSKVTDNEVDLLAEMDTTPTGPVENEDFDLLSDMSESDAKAWMPWDEEDQPKGIQGTVTHVGTVTADAKYGGADVPYVELRDKEETVWGIRGYSTVLGNQLSREIDNGLTSGDILAVVYKGVTTNRKGDNEYKNFATKSKHNH